MVIVDQLWLKIKDQIKVLDEFINAAEEKGIEKSEDFNTGDNEGMGYFQFTQKSHGLKM